MHKRLPVLDVSLATILTLKLVNELDIFFDCFFTLKFHTNVFGSLIRHWNPFVPHNSFTLTKGIDGFGNHFSQQQIMDMAVNKVINFSPCIRIAEHALNPLNDRIYGNVFGASFKVNIIISGKIVNCLEPFRFINLWTHPINCNRPYNSDIKCPTFLKLKTKSFNRVFN